MKPERSIVFLIITILLMVIAWTMVVAFAVGFDKFQAAAKGANSVSIESFGQFGASFGLLAALFAGMAIVLLWQSIRIQQRELYELRLQMEEDRSLNTLIWMLENYKQIRDNLRYEPQYGPATKTPSVGVKVLEALQLMMFGSRSRGDCTKDTSAREYEEILYQSYGGELSRLTVIAQPLAVSVEEIMRFVSTQKQPFQIRFIRLIWSVLTPRDLFVIHELAILRVDPSLSELLTNSSFFAGLDSNQKSVIKEGPRLCDTAYDLEGAIE